ncbi:MAG TPA: ribonuclease T [Citreicella sp.]|nr:ribonuclease T [Citreicella sp.]
MRWCLLLLLLTALPARAEGERPGRFDYYVLALSWSPTWCALEGRAEGSPQCDRALGWVLHGLWPQNRRGWPSYCPSPHPAPDRRQTAAMADIMGTSGLAWHQWRKHGSCTGLPATEYFALSRRAFESLAKPAALDQLAAPVTLPATLVEEAFLQANPGLAPDMLTITCRAGRIQEARLCLSKDLEPVPCGQDVVKDCQLSDALLDPARPAETPRP